MYYKFRKVFNYVLSTEVEADSLEEALKMRLENEWYEDEGGEHMLESEDVYIAESQTALEDGDYKEEEIMHY